MTNVTVNDTTAAAGPTPSQAIIADANRVVQVTDASGRVIEIKRMTMSTRRRVFKTISAENGEKERYLGLAMLAATVVSIDGTPVPFPTSEMQLDALIDRLDDDGFAAIAKGALDNFRAKETDTAGE